MIKKLTDEELQKIGVNREDLTYPSGEANIIVQSIGVDESRVKRGDLTVFPDIYQPRKNRIWSCEETGEYADLTNENEKEDWIEYLKDSAARLKIMAYTLELQIKEIREYGYPITSLYFPE